jgi:hypothetical protein
MLSDPVGHALHTRIREPSCAIRTGMNRKWGPRYVRPRRRARAVFATTEALPPAESGLCSDVIGIEDVSQYRQTDSLGAAFPLNDDQALRRCR